MKKQLYLLIFCLTTMQLATAQIQKWESTTALESKQWVVNDIIFKTKKHIDNPLMQPTYAIVSNENNQQKIPLFYNGNNEWVFRYSSSSVGEKSYVIKSVIKELDDQSGQIVMTENTKEGRHGGIVLNKENP